MSGCKIDHHSNQALEANYILPPQKKMQKQGVGGSLDGICFMQILTQSRE